MEKASPGLAFAGQLVAEVESVRRRSVAELVRLMSMAWSGELPTVPQHVGAREYAVAHHVVAIMQEGASRKDMRVMRQARQLWSALTGPPGRASVSPGDIIAAHHSTMMPLTQIDSDMPVWAVTPDALEKASDNRCAWIGPAVAAVDRAGYGWLTGNALAIVAALHARRLDEATSSWTVSTLPCTIYSDYYPAPALIGKDLVHESAHSWLNDCLAATRDRLDGPVEYWSPWKERFRTPFGIVHSGFAFSCVVNFLSWLVGAATEEAVVAYCERRLSAERTRLAQARAEVDRALKLAWDSRIWQMVQAEMALALDSASV